MRTFMIFVIVLVVAASLVNAAAPALMNYQGRIIFTGEQVINYDMKKPRLVSPGRVAHGLALGFQSYLSIKQNAPTGVRAIPDNKKSGLYETSITTGS